MAEPKVKITYTKSAIGYNQKQKDTLRALGLRRLGDSIERERTGSAAAVRVAATGAVRGATQTVPASANG